MSKPPLAVSGKRPGILQPQQLQEGAFRHQSESPVTYSVCVCRVRDMFQLY